MNLKMRLSEVYSLPLVKFYNPPMCKRYELTKVNINSAKINVKNY